MGNSETMARMEREIGALLENPESIDSLILMSSASPEGRFERNRTLAKERSKMANTLVEKFFPNVDPSRVKVESEFVEDWFGLIELVKNDPDLLGRDQILEIFNTAESTDECKERLKALENGKIYQNLIKTHFDDLRYCVVEARVIVGIEKPIEVADYVSLPLPPSPTPKIEFIQGEPPVIYHKHLKLKTNALGWVLAGSNIAVEVDLAKHFSISVPFYYSGGLDYFKETIKFRGIVLQPEFRYYPKLTEAMTNGGFFVGAHFGLGWYNFAVNTDYRVQDHEGNRPAFGGGIGLGYNYQFKKNPRWGMEFAIGAGVYDVLYDTFYNENNGPINEKAVRDVWFGIDNVAVSFTYNFDLKKGGKK